VVTAIIGAGVMGEAILAGLIRTGRDADSIMVGERRPERGAELSRAYGVKVVPNAEAAAADTLLMAVKPQDLGATLREIAPKMRAGQVLVSVAAGKSTEWIESLVPDGVAVVRAMPNTPALVGEGMAGLSRGSTVSDEQYAEAESLMSAIGKAIEIPEYQQDALTAVSGSGPAYIFYVVEAMVEAGVQLGLARDVSTALVQQTLFGAATMLRETGTHPSVLREQVTSPGGTTAAALRQLDEHGVRAAFMSAMEACRNRSRELAQGS
jgi:pyrroline-5-carboxylate reductase